MKEGREEEPEPENEEEADDGGVVGEDGES